MAVVGNRFTEIGDKAMILSSSLTKGIEAVENLIEDDENVTVDRFFIKTFRFSPNGINWTPWQPLTLLNLKNVDYSIDSTNFFFEIIYERGGTDPIGELVYNDLSIIVKRNEKLVDIIGDLPPFNGVRVTDPVVTQYCTNLYRKLYERGVLPQFITRNLDTVEPEQEKDFEDFWTSIACFFAVLYASTLRLEQIYFDDNMLKELLGQWDSFLCEQSSLEDAQFVAEHYFREISKRGTKSPFLAKGEFFQDGAEAGVDGEVLRLLCSNCDCCEYVYEFLAPYEIGWSLGRNSPTFRGLTFVGKDGRDRLNKIDDGLLFDEAGGEKSSVKYGKAVKLQSNLYGNPSFNQVEKPTGRIERVVTLNDQDEFELVFRDIVVDPFFTYESFFRLSADDFSGLLLSLEFVGRDCDGNEVFFKVVDTLASRPDGVLMQEQSLSSLLPGKAYDFRNFLFKSQNDGNEQTKNEWGVDNLRLNENNVNKTQKVDFKIVIKKVGISTTNATLEFLRFSPAVLKEKYGYLSSTVAALWAKNNNENFSKEEINGILQNKILDYKMKLLSELTD
jgi:hypothetical protein